MKELSLHINDIVENSIRANASLIQLLIEEDILKDTLTIQILDNGCGIPKEKLEHITNPFETSRTTRKVGLGLPLFKSAAERCNGSLNIESDHRGTKVAVTFQHSHIDRAPLGNLPSTLMAIILSLENHMDVEYKHQYNDKEFTLDTRQIRAVLGKDIPLSNIEVLNWIKDSIRQGLDEIRKSQ